MELLTNSIVGFFYLQERDSIDGKDLKDITQDADELRHYFPKIKERLKFKKLVISTETADDQIASLEAKIYNFIIFTAKCVQRPLGHVEPQRLPKKSCALLLALRSSYSPTVFSPRHLEILLLAYCSHLLENFIFNY